LYHASDCPELQIQKVFAMVKEFGSVPRIETRELLDLVSAYSDALIDEATANGSLDDLCADNGYTREIGRTVRLCAADETDFLTFKHVCSLSPASCQSGGVDFGTT
jgi:hypothetical protein